MILITSKENHKLKLLIKLKQKKYREKHGIFMLEGIRSVEQAIDNSMPIESIFVSASFEHENSKMCHDIAKKASCEIYSVEDSILKTVFDTVTPQGIIALAKIENVDYTSIDYEQIHRIVFLDRVQDPGNLGTIARTADAAGYDLLVLSKGCADIYSPKAVRSTMGSILNIKIITNVDSKDFIEFIKNKGYELISSSLEGSSNYKSVQLQGKSAIVFGNEGSGIENSILDASDHLVKIPIYGKAESLNVSVAAGILLYHFSPDY
jgi:TrmH family RNA methyltransferase